MTFSWRTAVSTRAEELDSSPEVVASTFPVGTGEELVSAVDCADVSASPELEDAVVVTSEASAVVPPSAEEAFSASVDVSVEGAPDAELSDAPGDPELLDVVEAVLPEDVSALAVPPRDVSPPLAEAPAELSPDETPTDAPPSLELPEDEELALPEEEAPLSAAPVKASA